MAGQAVARRAGLGKAGRRVVGWFEALLLLRFSAPGHREQDGGARRPPRPRRRSCHAQRQRPGPRPRHLCHRTSLPSRSSFHSVVCCHQHLSLTACSVRRNPCRGRVCGKAAGGSVPHPSSPWPSAANPDYQSLPAKQSLLPWRISSSDRHIDCAFRPFGNPPYESQSVQLGIIRFRALEYRNLLSAQNPQNERSSR